MVAPLQGTGKAMSGKKWLSLGAGVGVIACAALLGRVPAAHASTIGFSLNGTCVGTCPPDSLSVGSSDSLPVSFDTTINGDTFQIVGTPSSTNSGSIVSSTPFSIQYLGDGYGGTSQADTLTADVYYGYTSTATISTFSNNQTGSFSSAIAPASTAQVSVALNGANTISVGPFTASNGTTFSQAKSSSVSIAPGNITVDKTYTTTFAAGSAVGSYVTYGTAPAPGPVVTPPVVSATCAAVIAGGVNTPTLGNPSFFDPGLPTTIQTTFSPGGGLTLNQAAVACGVKGFDWVQQYLEIPSPSPFYAASNPTVPLTTEIPQPPIPDPPAGGLTSDIGCHGIVYGIALEPSFAVRSSNPFYYNPNPAYNYAPGGYVDCMALNTTAHIPNPFTLSFFDSPADACLSGTQLLVSYLSGNAECGTTRAPAGEGLQFETELVGYNISSTGTYYPVNLCTLVDALDEAACEEETTFYWEDTFNGTAGGISLGANFDPSDADTGSGGITLLSMEPTTVSEPSSFTLWTIPITVLMLVKFIEIKTRIERPRDI